MQTRKRMGMKIYDFKGHTITPLFYSFFIISQRIFVVNNEKKNRGVLDAKGHDVIIVCPFRGMRSRLSTIHKCKEQPHLGANENEKKIYIKRVFEGISSCKTWDALIVGAERGFFIFFYVTEKIFFWRYTHLFFKKLAEGIYIAEI